jgi:hypothetical protein
MSPTWIQLRVATFIVLVGEPKWHSLRGLPTDQSQS